MQMIQLYIKAVKSIKKKYLHKITQKDFEFAKKRYFNCKMVNQD